MSVRVWVRVGIPLLVRPWARVCGCVSAACVCMCSCVVACVCMCGCVCGYV